jgi:fumarate hydratase class II
MIHSIQRLAASVRWCAAHRMNGTLHELMERSLIKVTALAQKIRCDNAAKMAKSTEPN